MINQKVNHKGFSSVQIGLMFLVVGICGMILMFLIGIYTLLVLPIIAMPIVLIGKRIKEENDKGNPDFIGSVFYFMKVNKGFSDKRNVLMYLDREKEG